MKNGYSLYISILNIRIINKGINELNYVFFVGLTINLYFFICIMFLY